MSRFFQVLSWVVLMGLAAACGKNEVLMPYPQQPIYQAPQPSGYSPYGVPGYGQQPSYYPGGFNPQMPAGYPSAYTPFLPVDYYMRNNPQLAPQWPQMWNQWRNYSTHYGYSQYDFNRFWFEFCPQQWNTGVHYQIYVFLDQNFYSWAGPQTRYPTTMSPAHFWSYYQGY